MNRRWPVVLAVVVTILLVCGTWTVLVLSGAQRKLCHESWYWRYRYCGGFDPGPTTSSTGN